MWTGGTAVDGQSTVHGDPATPSDCQCWIDPPLPWEGSSSSRCMDGWRWHCTCFCPCEFEHCYRQSRPLLCLSQYKFRFCFLSIAIFNFTHQQLGRGTSGHITNFIPISQWKVTPAHSGRAKAKPLPPRHCATHKDAKTKAKAEIKRDILWCQRKVRESPEISSPSQRWIDSVSSGDVRGGATLMF